MSENVGALLVDVLRPRLKYLKPTDELDLDRDLRSLGLDSMASISLLLDIEEAFDITMPDEYLVEETFSTARSLWRAISSLKEDRVRA
jgi:acyl carrier protein